MRRLIKKAFEEADQWLQKYTSDTWAAKAVPDDEIVEDLKAAYPLDGPTTLYRGINFRTQEQYEKFMEEISSGVWESQTLTSWTKDPGIAEQFATITQIDVPDLETLKIYDEMKENKEKIAGYRGVILQTEATPEMALCDVTKSQYDREKEVILLPGSIPVKIYKEIKRFKDEFNGQDINEYIQKNKNNLDKKSLDYILHHHADELDDTSREIIYDYYKPNRILGVVIEQRNDTFEDSDDYYVAVINFNYGFMNQVYQHLPESLQEEVLEQIQEEAEQVAQILNENKDKIKRYEGTKLSTFSEYVDPSTMDLIYQPLTELINKQRADADNQIRIDLRGGKKLTNDMVQQVYNDFLQNLSMV